MHPCTFLALFKWRATKLRLLVKKLLESCSNKINCIDRLRIQDLGVFASIVITEIFKNRLKRLGSDSRDPKMMRSTKMLQPS